jgi:hypothetical protein
VTEQTKQIVTIGISPAGALLILAALSDAATYQRELGEDDKADEYSDLLQELVGTIGSQ